MVTKKEVDVMKDLIYDPFNDTHFDSTHIFSCFGFTSTRFALDQPLQV
jgi:hypothetical protein